MKIITDNFNNNILSCEPKSILDVGSGSGRYYEWCEKHSIDYFGIDVDATLIKQAKAKYGTNVFQVFNGYDLSKFTNDSYDVILLVEVMEHVQSLVTLNQLLKECTRVAKNFILFTTPNSSDEQFLIDHRIIYHHYTHSFGPEFDVPIAELSRDNPHLHHLKFTKKSMEKILRPLVRSFVVEEAVPLDIRSTRESNRVMHFKLWGIVDCRTAKKLTIAKHKQKVQKLLKIRSAK